MSSYSQHFKASSRTPGMLWDLHRQLYCPFHSWERMCLGHINRSCVLDMTKYENESFTPPRYPKRINQHTRNVELPLITNERKHLVDKS